jgi:hypothetical protein
MNLAFLIFGLFGLIATVVTIVALATAPDGYEDQTGFHVGPMTCPFSRGIIGSPFEPPRAFI